MRSVATRNGVTRSCATHFDNNKTTANKKKHEMVSHALCKNKKSNTKRRHMHYVRLLNRYLVSAMNDTQQHTQCVRQTKRCITHRLVVERVVKTVSRLYCTTLALRTRLYCTTHKALHYTPPGSRASC
jgi:hypothetical protein